VSYFTDQQAKSIDMCEAKSDGQGSTACLLETGQTVVLKHQYLLVCAA